MRLSNVSCKHSVASVRCAHVARRVRPKVATSPATAAATSSRPLEMLERGALIVVEGGDRSGKSTQIRLLVKELEERGAVVWVMSCPNRQDGATGPMLVKLLQGELDMCAEAIHLMFAANRWQQIDKVYECLARGDVVIFDRYAYSGVAYSAAKGLGLEWCKACEVGLPAPDQVVLLQVDTAAAATRPGYGGELYEKKDMQDKVRAIFEELREPEWLVIDGTQDMQEVHNQLLPSVLETIQRCQQGLPIKKLWAADAREAP